jgi:acetyl esterase
MLPELRAMLEDLDLMPAVNIMTVAPAGERAASEVRLRELWGAIEDVAEVREMTMSSAGHTLRMRLYRPAAREPGTVLFFHGGGWVVGSLDTHDGSVRALANRVGSDVLSVEYRKGPEYPFPACVVDCDAALDWLIAEGPKHGLDVSRIVLCGESAGGTLAAVVARHARDRDIALAGQALIYPPTDAAMDTRSYRDFATGYYLAADAMRWFYTHYLPAWAEGAHPDASPLRASNLSGLAPAFIATAGFDPLRDEGRAYAARLIEAGNDMTYREIAGAVHGLWLMNGKTPATVKLIADTAEWIAGRLRG